MEAFSDGVIAIIITIMVLELKVPHGDNFEALKPLLPVFASYVLSFVNVAIYWNNHHHMMHAAHKVNGNVLWANMHLLFWLSLVPAATGWMGENNFTRSPVIVYGIVLFMASIAYYILAHSLTILHGKQSEFSRALGNDRKGKLSSAIYLLGIGSSFFLPLAGFACYVLVAIIWFIPDKRFVPAET
jgi:uncharacterized membrane protein